MSKVVVTTPINRQSLRNKSKDELIDIVLLCADTNGKLRGLIRDSKSFVNCALEFWDWSLFPHSEQSARELRDKLAAAVAEEDGGQ